MNADDTSSVLKTSSILPLSSSSSSFTSSSSTDSLFLKEFDFADEEGSLTSTPPFISITPPTKEVHLETPVITKLPDSPIPFHTDLPSPFLSSNLLEPPFVFNPANLPSPSLLPPSPLLLTSSENTLPEPLPSSPSIDPNSLETNDFYLNDITQCSSSLSSSSHPKLTVFLERLSTLKSKFDELFIEKKRIELENEQLKSQLQNQTTQTDLLNEQLKKALESNASVLVLQKETEIELRSTKAQLTSLETQFIDLMNEKNNVIQEKDLLKTMHSQLETSLVQMMLNNQRLFLELHSSRPPTFITSTSSFLSKEKEKQIEQEKEQPLPREGRSVFNESSQDPISTEWSSSTSKKNTNVSVSTETLCNPVSSQDTPSEQPIDKEISTSNLISSSPKTSTTGVVAPTNETVLNKKESKISSLTHSASTPTRSQVESTKQRSSITSSTPSSSLTSSSSSLALELRHTKAELQRVQDQLQVLHGQLGAALTNNEKLESQVRQLQRIAPLNKMKSAFDPLCPSLTASKTLNVPTPSNEKEVPVPSVPLTFNSPTSPTSNSTSSSSGPSPIYSSDPAVLNSTVLKLNDPCKQDLATLTFHYQQTQEENQSLHLQVTTLQHELQTFKQQEETLLDQFEQFMTYKEQWLKKYEMEQQQWFTTFQSQTLKHSEMQLEKEELMKELNQVKQRQTKERQVHEQVLREANQLIQSLTQEKQHLIQELNQRSLKCEPMSPSSSSSSSSSSLHSNTKLKSELNNGSRRTSSSDASLFNCTETLHTLKSEFLLLEKSYLAQIEHLHRELYFYKEQSANPRLNSSSSSSSSSTFSKEPSPLPLKKDEYASTHSHTFTSKKLINVPEPPTPSFKQEFMSEEMKVRSILASAKVPRLNSNTKPNLKIRAEEDVERQVNSNAHLRLPSNASFLIPTYDAMLHTNKDTITLPYIKALLYLKQQLHQCQLDRDSYSKEVENFKNKLTLERHLFTKSEHIPWLLKAKQYKSQLKQMSLYRDSLVQQKKYLMKSIEAYQQSELATYRILHDLGLPYPFQPTCSSRSLTTKFRSIVIFICFLLHFRKKRKTPLPTTTTTKTSKVLGIH